MAGTLHVVSEVDLDLVSDDPAAQRAISVRLVCGDDLDPGQAAGGAMSLNLFEDAGNYVVEEEEDFVERKKLFTVDGKNFRLRTRIPDGQKTILVKKGQQDASTKLFGASGVRVQTSFFPNQIQINASTGVVTILSSRSTLSDIPRQVPSKVGKPPAFRKLVPGMNIGLIACNGKVVCAENCGAGTLNATRTVITSWETFSVVKPANSADNAIGLGSGANGKYVRYAEKSLIASSTQVFHAECFIEVDAGEGKIALKIVDKDQYVGGGPDLFLVPWLREWEMFEVKPVVHAW